MVCEKGNAPALPFAEAGVADAGEGPARGVLAMIFLVRNSNGGEVSFACSLVLAKVVPLSTGVEGCAAAAICRYHPGCLAHDLTAVKPVWKHYRTGC